MKIIVGKYTIYFHGKHGNDPAAQKHVHIKIENNELGARNYDGSLHHGVDYNPTKK